MKTIKYLTLTVVQGITILIIFTYCLFAIVFISVPVRYNLAECERLETNYVICQQYETSSDLTIWAIANLFSFPIDMSGSRFSYQLKGTEIYDGVLYLETNNEPILYKHRVKNSYVSRYSESEAKPSSIKFVNDSQTFKVPIEKVSSLIRGTGTAKSTLRLENLYSTSIYLSVYL